MAEKSFSYAPNGPWVPRYPTPFVPKNAQNFSGGQKPAEPAANTATTEQKRQGLMDLFGEINRANSARAQQEAPAPEAPPAPRGGGGGGSNLAMLNAMFNPLFENLAQREEAANKRYEANTQQVTNIYGQITNARTADIGTTATAFQRLSEAAANRSSAVNTQIDESEAARLRNNQAALESMGLAGLSTPQGDIASQGAAMAQNTNRLNAENWQGLLSAMGVNAQDIARSDVTGFNYRMGEDLGQLRGAREQFAQDIEQQRSQLVSQKAQATFEYQQAQQRAAAAAAAAQQRAAFDAQDAAAKQQAEALKSSGPVTRIVANRFQNGFLTEGEAAKVTNSINEWFTNVAPPASTGRWNAGSARNSLLGIAGDQLNSNEKSAIIAIFDEMNW